MYTAWTRCVLESDIAIEKSPGPDVNCEGADDVNSSCRSLAKEDAALQKTITI